MPKFSVPKFNIASKPNIPNIEKFKAFVTKKVGDTSKLTLPPYEELYRKYYKEIVEEWEKSKSLEKLSPKTFNKIPVVVVISFGDDLKLIDNDKFRQAWLALMANRQNARHARKIYRAILRNYKSYHSHLEHVFAYIKPLIKSSSMSLCQKLSALDDQYDLLSHLLVKNITDYILQRTDKPIEDILLDMGIVGALREAEISAAVGKNILTRNRAYLQNEDDSMLARTLEYFQNDTDAQPTLRLNYMRNDLLTSLLGNYLNQDPPAHIKQQIEGFADRYLGDPRSNPKWQGVEEKIKNIVVQWKIGVTLRSFFALLDYVAQHDDMHDRHWRERKEFWQGYLDAGKITGAWVVLGRKYLYNHDFLNKGNLKFAKFSTHAGIQSSHCAIIMQVNGLVLTEWSHVGALRIWETGDRRAPQLYQEAYDPDDLKSIKTYEDGYLPHHRNWQERARDILDGDETFRRW